MPMSLHRDYHLTFSTLYIFAELIKRHLVVALLCIVLTASEVEHLSVHLFAILIFSSANCLFTAFAGVSVKMFVSQPHSLTQFSSLLPFRLLAQLPTSVPSAAV